MTDVREMDAYGDGYLSDVLRRMTDGHPVNRLDDLLPRNWTPKPVNP